MNDILNVGFNNLKVKIIKKKSKVLICKAISSGKLENNKGVHVENRKVKIDFLTKNVHLKYRSMIHANLLLFY